MTERKSLESWRAELVAIADQIDVFIKYGTSAVFEQDDARKIASALRSLAAQDQKPCGWQWSFGGSWHTVDTRDVSDPEKYARLISSVVRPIYTDPPPAAGWDQAIEAAKKIAAEYGDDVYEDENMNAARRQVVKFIVRDIEALRHNAPPDTGAVESEPITCDFMRSFPDGTADNSTYGKIEDELDKIEAPFKDANGKWLSLHERIAAIPFPPHGGADAGVGSFQSRVQPWMMACFGPEISADRIERNHRFLEEALELVQSNGCTQSEAHQLVDYVYGRPQGEINQEVGGVMVTLAALCLANGIDMHEGGETELARVWTKVEKIRAKQAAKPKHSPLPGPSEPAPVAANASAEARLREALDLLQLQQRGRAQALRLLDAERKRSFPETLARADTYEECGNELNEILLSHPHASDCDKQGADR